MLHLDIERLAVNNESFKLLLSEYEDVVCGISEDEDGIANDEDVQDKVDTNNGIYFDYFLFFIRMAVRSEEKMQPTRKKANFKQVQERIRKNNSEEK